MPGFFFVRTFSKTRKSDFEYLMFSMFWGILLMVLFYKILPVTKFTPLLNNPYAGAVIFSVLAYLLSITINLIKSFLRRITNGTW
jgi:hypothetical protein